jgi:hypothetical protein
MEKSAGDVTVPYFVHEGEMARMERINKKLWILCIVLFLAFAVTNAGWIYYESQFIDEVTVTQENEDGYNSYIGSDGDINNYGKANDKANPET